MPEDVVVMVIFEEMLEEFTVATGGGVCDTIEAATALEVASDGGGGGGAEAVIAGVV